MSKDQCKGHIQSGDRCKREIDSDIEYCWQHMDQKPRERLSKPSTPSKPVSKPPPVSKSPPSRGPTGPLQLPPDVLREIQLNLPVAEILNKCRTNKQFNDVVCNNLVFWQRLSAKKGIPPKFIAGKSLPELKRYLYNFEHIPRVYDIPEIALEYIAPGATNTDLRKMRPPFIIDHTRVQSVCRPGVDELLESIKRQYYEYYKTQANRVFRSRKARLMDSRQFYKEMDHIYDNLHPYDIIITGGDLDDRWAQLYMALPVTSEAPSVVCVLRGFEENAFEIPAEAFELIEKIYIENGARPITREMIDNTYGHPGLHFSGFNLFHTPGGGQFVKVGGENDPVEEFRGVPVHVAPVAGAGMDFDGVQE